MRAIIFFFLLAGLHREKKRRSILFSFLFSFNSRAVYHSLLDDVHTTNYSKDTLDSNEAKRIGQDTMRERKKRVMAFLSSCMWLMRLSQANKSAHALYNLKLHTFIPTDKNRQKTYVHINNMHPILVSLSFSYS